MNLCSMVAFSNNLSDQDVSDTLNSFLIAQLIADKKQQRFGSNWYSEFNTVMSNIGWTTVSSKTRTDVARNDYFYIRDLIDTFSSLDGDDARFFKATLLQAESMGRGDSLREYLEYNTHSNSGINIQFCNVRYDSPLAIDLFSLRFSSVVPVRTLADRLSQLLGDTGIIRTRS